MACGNDALQVELFGNGELAEVPGAIPDVIESAGPAATGISDPAIIPGSKSRPRLW